MAVAGTFLPISEISSYQTKWMIKARVTNKAPMRTFKRGTGEGKVFHVDLLDSAGGEIRASFFNDAADKYFDLVEVKKCYKFSKGSAKIANRQYNTTNHRYELTFEKDAVIESVADDTGIAELSSFKFVDIAAVAQKQAPCRVDLCGIVSAFKPIGTVTTKDGRELTKRDITLVDDTGSSMEVTLWNELAQTEDKKFESNPLIGIKSILVKEFNGGRSGSTLERNGLFFEPDGSVANRIRKWWASGGSSQAVASISSTGGGGGRARNARDCNLATMRQASENAGEQPEFYNCVGRMALLQFRKKGEQVPIYREVVKDGKANLRFLIRCRFTDFSDSAWLTTFHEAAEQVLKMKVEDVQAIETGDGGQEKLEEQIQKRYFVDPVQLTIRAKMDSYNGEPRSNVCCVEARPLNRREHGRVLLKEIQQMIAA